MKTVRALVPALLIAASATPVFAYEAGDFIVRGGAAYVAPNTDAGNINSPFDALNGIADPVEVEGAGGVTLTGTYLFHKNFGIEVVGALPFKHDINADKTVESLGLDTIGETKHLPPTILLQFYPLESNSFVQPYVGAGINYTIFFENDTNDAFAARVASVLGAPVVDTTLDLDESVGLGLEVGADWAVDKNFSVNTSIWYLDIDTTATVDARLADGSKVRDAAKFDVSIDPFVYAVGLAYKF
jgi:outer membrane protein